VYRINPEEAELPLSEYPTILSLFQRKLAANARPIDYHEDIIVSPVDGIVTAMGGVSSETTMLVKEETYKVRDLLQSRKAARAYQGGSYIIIYMPAGAYHHVHSPFDGLVIWTRLIKGQHYPLNALAQKSVSKLYIRNTRQINFLQPLVNQDDAGKRTPVALIQVASSLVGTIVNRFSSDSLEIEPSFFKKGEELGYFTFGSTVALVFPPGDVELIRQTRLGQTLRVGEPIARFLP